MKNKVQHYRQRMKLSQRRLAELVGTSQQQIQRLETGSAPVRLDIGTQICKALQQPMNVVFPGSANAMKNADNERKRSEFLELDAWKDVRDSGLEPDMRVWTIKIGLRGYEEPLCYGIPSGEKSRLFKEIQKEESAYAEESPFVVFESTERMVAINLRELNYCYFQFERADIAERIALSKEKSNADAGLDATNAMVYSVGGGKPLLLDLLIDEQFDEDGAEMGECRGIFYELQNDFDNSKKIFLTNSDGETAVIRVGNLALLDIPLLVLEGEKEVE